MDLRIFNIKNLHNPNNFCNFVLLILKIYYMSILPVKKSEKRTQNPKNLIMFGLPKVGKTTVLAELPNCLTIDLEDGTRYIEGYNVSANNYVDLYKIAKALKEEGIKVTFSVEEGVNEIVKGLPQTLYSLKRFNMTENMNL